MQRLYPLSGVSAILVILIRAILSLFYLRVNAIPTRIAVDFTLLLINSVVMIVTMY